MARLDASVEQQLGAAGFVGTKQQQLSRPKVPLSEQADEANAVGCAANSAPKKQARSRRPKPGRVLSWRFLVLMASWRRFLRLTRDILTFPVPPRPSPHCGVQQELVRRPGDRLTAPPGQRCGAGEPSRSHFRNRAMCPESPNCSLFRSAVTSMHPRVNKPLSRGLSNAAEQRRREAERLHAPDGGEREGEYASRERSGDAALASTSA